MINRYYPKLQFEALLGEKVQYFHQPLTYLYRTKEVLYFTLSDTERDGRILI